MTSIRRTLLLVALTVAAVVGGLGPAHPADATFSEKVGVATSVATANVAAPTNVVGSLTCGRSSATMAATWQLSSSARTEGYVVKVHFSDGFVQTVDMSAASTTSWSAPISLYNATNYSIQFSVTTVTDYGWTKESTRTGWFRC